MALKSRTDMEEPVHIATFRPTPILDVIPDITGMGYTLHIRSSN